MTAHAQSIVFAALALVSLATQAVGQAALFSAYIDAEEVLQTEDRPRLDSGFQIWFEGKNVTIFVPNKQHINLTCSKGTDKIKILEAMYIYGPPYFEETPFLVLDGVTFLNSGNTQMEVPCNMDSNVRTLFGKQCNGRNWCDVRAEDPEVFRSWGGTCNIIRPLVIRYRCTSK